MQLSHPATSPPSTADSGAATPDAAVSDATVSGAAPSDAALSQHSILAVEILIGVVESLSLARDLAQIISLVRTAARQLTGADGASFILREGNHCFYADEDAISPLWKGQRFPMENCISGWVMNHRVPVAIPDVFQDARIPADVYRPTFVRSLAMVPIRTLSPLGAIGNYWAQRHTPAADQLRLLQALADSTAIAIENVNVRSKMEELVRIRTEQIEAANRDLRAEANLRKQMESKVMRLSLTDELTGLSNRRGFLMRAEQMLKIIHRLHTHGWLVYIDLDGLKNINDIQGHEAGDRLIRGAAKVLRESFRDSDILGRIDGDEFVVFATGDATPSVEIEQRLARNMDHYNRFHIDQAPLSMSIGVIRCDPHAVDTLDDMIHQADAAMYIEKRRRRVRHNDQIADQTSD